MTIKVIKKSILAGSCGKCKSQVECDNIENLSWSNVVGKFYTVCPVCKVGTIYFRNKD